MESDRKKVIIWGGELKKKIQFDVAEKQVIYRDRDHNENFFSINDDILSRHIVMIGGSGSGKTNVFNLTLDQLRRKKNENDIFIIFDTKGDFLRRFGRGGDMVLGNGRDYRKISSRWNLFDDILADGNSPDDYELNAKELAASLFADRGSASQPFFANAARDIFANVIIYFIRCAEENNERKKLLNNRKLVQFFQEANSKI